MNEVDSLQGAFELLLDWNEALLEVPLVKLLPLLNGRQRQLLLSLAEQHDATSLAELWDALDDETLLLWTSPSQVRDLSLVVESLAQRGRAARPPSGAAGATERKPLEEWAAQHGIAERLRDPAAAMFGPGVDAGTSPFFDLRGSELTVLDAHLGDIPPAVLQEAKGLFRYYHKPRKGELTQAFRRYATHYLDGCAAAVARRREAEAEIAAFSADSSPGNAHAVRFARLCASARTDAHAHAPEPPPGLCFVLDAAFEPALLRVTVASRSFREDRWEQTRSTEVGLGRWELGELDLRCSCGQSGGRCPHAALALSTALGLLVQDRSPLFEHVRVPGWQRLVGALDELVTERARSAATESMERLAWRIEVKHGTVQLVPLVQKQGKKGGFTKGRRVEPHRLGASRRRAMSARERDALELLSRSYGAPERATLVAALRLLEKHPRLSIDGREEPPRIENVTLRVDIEEHGEAFELVTWLDDQRLTPADLLAAVDGTRHFVHLLPGENRCLVGELDSAALVMLRSIARHGAVVPRHAADELLRRLPELQEHVDVALPRSLLGRRVESDDRFHVALAEAAPGVVDVSVRICPFGQGPRLIPGHGLSRMTGARGGRRVHVLRDLGAERARLERWLGASALSAAEALGPADRRVSGDADIVALLSLLEAGSAAGEIVAEWSGPPLRLAGTLSKSALTVEVSSRRDWLGVGGSAEIDGQRVELAMLLDAARSGRRWVKLAPRHFALLEAELVEAARDMADLLHRRERGLALPPALAGAFESAVDGARVDGADAFHAAVERARAARGYEPRVPRGLGQVLRPYQVEGYRWLARMARWGVGACLADDMGLGKTLQCLGVLLERKEQGPALVVAPTSLGYNWLDEAARFAPGLSVKLYRGKERASLLEALGPGSVLVTSYDIATRDVEALADIDFATLVLDEAQNVKNALTGRAKAIRKLRARWRVALTGTPLENRLAELWGLFDALEPGLLGGWEEFSRRFARPIEVEGDRGRLDALSGLIRPFVLRRTKREVLPELPPRTERVQRVPLSAGEQALYDSARLAALGRIQSGSSDARIELLAALTRLRRLVCHPRLYDAESTLASSKLDALLEILADLGDAGRRALVFSQFTSFLDLVQSAVAQAGIPALHLDGSTPAKERARRVEAFQRGEADVFLISLKAGGTGLNLTAADCVVHLDPWWNPAVEDQATDRAHRIGQDRAVDVVRLVAAGTIEELVLDLHGDKRALAASVLEGTDAGARLSNDDLVQLLEHGLSNAAADDAPPSRRKPTQRRAQKTRKRDASPG
jgi:superfamily II DNA or RNA helicase